MSESETSFIPTSHFNSVAQALMTSVHGDDSSNESMLVDSPLELDPNGRTFIHAVFPGETLRVSFSGAWSPWIKPEEQKFFGPEGHPTEVFSGDVAKFCVLVVVTDHTGGAVRAIPYRGKEIAILGTVLPWIKVYAQMNDDYYGDNVNQPGNPMKAMFFK